MSKWHIFTLHPGMTVYNAIFEHMDGMRLALAKKKTQWKQDLYFRMKVAGQKMPKYFAELAAMTGLLLMSAHILGLLRKLQ